MNIGQYIAIPTADLQFSNEETTSRVLVRPHFLKMCLRLPLRISSKLLTSLPRVTLVVVMLNKRYLLRNYQIYTPLLYFHTFLHRIFISMLNQCEHFYLNTVEKTKMHSGKLHVYQLNDDKQVSFHIKTG